MNKPATQTAIAWRVCFLAYKGIFDTKIFGRKIVKGYINFFINYYIMKKFFIPILFFGALLSSCNDDKNCEITPEGELTPVIMSPAISDFTQSKAVKMDWAQNDAIAIFSDIGVLKNGSTSTSSITYTRGATNWTPPSADNQWYFANATSQHNFYAYYPVGTATSYTSVEIPDISGQDGKMTLQALKEQNDFMRGAAVATKSLSSMADIQMFRVFTIINLNVKLKQNDFAGNAATLTSVKLSATASHPLVNPTSSDKATVNLSNGHVTCATGAINVTLQPAGGFALTPTAVSIPVKVYPQQTTIQVEFTIGGKTSVAKALNISNYVGGHVYNFDVTLGADLLEVGIGDPIIFDWISNDGTPITPSIPN